MPVVTNQITTVKIKVDKELQLRILVRWDNTLGIFVSWCPALDLYSQGTSRKSAHEAMEDTIELMMETCYNLGTLVQFLKGHGHEFASPQRLTRNKPIVDMEKWGLE